jgi:hypothetical protein
VTLFLDIGAVPICHCDDHLEALHKALAEDPAGDAKTIWDRHENPFIAQHVEDVTARFQAILSQIQSAFARFLIGEPMEQLAKADAPWMRMNEEALANARYRLENKPPATYTLDDWMELCEVLIATYLPADVIKTEAEYLTVRAALLGKIEAEMQLQGTPPPDNRILDQLAELVPSRFGQIPPKLLSPVEMATVRIAKARAAENIQMISDATRHKMAGIVVDHVQAMMLGQRQGTDRHLATALADAFGQLNRDFRRVAVTEAGECCNQGFVAAQPVGQTVMRREAYRGACEFCKSINGKVFTVVDPMDQKKNGETQVWVGKTNAGRSASSRRRVGNELVLRGDGEKWWAAAGVIHPHCRGSWARVSTSIPPGVNPAFDAWLRNKLKTIGLTGAASRPI